MRTTVLAFIFCLTLALSACGELDTDDLTPEPEQPDEALIEFETQELSWGSCDDALPPEAGAVFASLGDRLECAVINLPLDWENPGPGDAKLDLLRVKAGDEQKRKGAIFVNPGGPGIDGFLYGALLGLTFAGDRRPTAAPELLSQVSKSYDILGFSPRGTGSSFQLLCESDATPPNVEPYTVRTEENIQALLTQARLSAEACLNDPQSSYINTEQTVQDMDLVRRLMDDEKLNFLGFSYGSWLGAWYAKRFPENAGNIVLSGNPNFAAPWQDTITLEALGTQRGFEDVVVPYLARNDARFGLGTTNEEVYGVYESLRVNLKAATTDIITTELSNSSDAPIIAQNLVAARGVNTILEGLESPPTPDDGFLEQVAAYAFAEDEDTNAELSELAVKLAQTYLGLSVPSPARLLPSGGTYTAVTCNDSVWDQDPEAYAELGNEQNELHPLWGGRLTMEPCAFWGEPTTTPPDVPENLPSVLMVQTGYDVRTPAEGALQAFESLPNARLIYLEDELSHAVFPYNTECVDVKIASFLLDGSLPADTVSNCDAKPLPDETQVFSPGTAPSAPSTKTTPSVKAAPTREDKPVQDEMQDAVTSSD